MVSAGTSASQRPRPTEAAPTGLLVIGAGFGRTGTSSLQEALEILGYGPCYHMREVIKDPQGFKKWDAIAMKEPEARTAGDWDAIFHGYQSTVDVPGASFWSDLIDVYLNAKVILTVRDPEKWYNSVLETIAPAPLLWKILYKFTFLEGPGHFRRFFENAVWGPFCGGSHVVRSGKDTMVKAFQDWNQRVRDTVPKERLLEFQVKDGWKPLCDFLECPIPPDDVPFPHAWKSENFQLMIKERKKRALTRLAIGAVFVATSAVLVLRRKNSY